MTPDQTRQLLGEIAAIDNRKLTPDIVRLWHEMLHAFDHHQAQNAVRTIRLNTPDVWITPGHIAQIMRRELRDAGRNRTPECDHSIALGAYCHDCTHGDACPTCHTPNPQPGDDDW